MNFKRIIRRARKTGVFVSPNVTIVKSIIHNQPTYFSVRNQKDSIQRHHFEGRFYEPEELEIISRYFPHGGVFFDIGSNVGNHSLYAVKFLHASLVIPVEPNPVAVELLLSNIFLNGVENQFDLSAVGFGVSNKNVDGMGVNWHPRNLGGAKLVEGAGDIVVVSADTIAAGRHIDMIKIDVEGMEIDVLEGLEETIARCEPSIFIEVDNTNIEKFDEWLETSNYRIAERFRRYKVNENYLLLPQKNNPIDVLSEKW